MQTGILGQLVEGAQRTLRTFQQQQTLSVEASLYACSQQGEHCAFTEGEASEECLHTISQGPRAV